MSQDGLQATATKDIRINLGCGPNTAPNWENYDRSPMQLLRKFPAVAKAFSKVGILTQDHLQQWPDDVQRRNLAKPLPQADQTVSATYSSHMLEHLYLDDARKLLAECHRVMKPGAIIRLALPDGEQIAREFLDVAEGDDGSAGLRFQEMLRAHPDAKPTGRRKVTFVGGSNYHKWQPTRGLVKSLLEEAGFGEFVELKYREGRLPDVEAVEVREDYTMFFEAVRI